jgi:lysophospholipase L1-like esterase
MTELRLPALLAMLLPILFLSACQRPVEGVRESSSYLAEVKVELLKTWPKNKTINLVFHGHSVPAGYFRTPAVHTLEAYPQQLLQHLKADYPNSVINSITTAIGGENSEQGAKRFRKEVLCHQPDVVFIDYALNDRSIGLKRARTAWERMIRSARAAGVPVILLTPSPDKAEDVLAQDTRLQRHANQIRELARQQGVGLVDSYAAFGEQVKAGVALEELMAQGNHPNARGHSLIADRLLSYYH